MSGYLYDVTMNTLIGKRHGELNLDTLEGTVSGSLMLFGIKHPILGDISPCGACQLTGTLQTLIHRLPFRAEGHVWPQKIELELICESRSYCLSGKRREG